ncbi:YesL family protein [Kribbella sp. NBC_00482]|uniref:YesL family protein n=1 Tax=Kribbella sp. NBC_00482 TaxID=2975968 RepID=UPI002E1833EF
MELAGRTFYRWLEWPARLALVSALWILGVLAGAVVVGIAPSTLAAHKVISSSPDAPAWSTFWSGWREWLGRGQIVLGLPLATVWVLGFYLTMARQTVVAVPLSLVLLGYLVTLWLLPAVAVVGESRRTTAIWILTIHVAWRRPVVPVAAAIALVAAGAGAWYVVPAALLFAPATAALGAVLVSSRLLTRDSPDLTRSGQPAR